MRKKAVLALPVPEPEPPPAENEGVESRLEAQFYQSLSPEQRTQYLRLCERYHAQREETSASDTSSAPRDRLYAAFEAIQEKVSAQRLEQLIDKGIEKGDASLLRLLAQMAGIDLSERPGEAASQGAQVILVTPHPLEP